MVTQNNLSLEELCPFIDGTCRQPFDKHRCSSYYDSCSIYLRLKVLNRNPVLTGLQRFQMKYKDFDYRRQLGI